MLTTEAIVARAHALVHARTKPRKKVFGIPLPAVIAILLTDSVVACTTYSGRLI